MAFACCAAAGVRTNAASAAAVNNVRRQEQSGASMYSAGYTLHLSKFTKLYGFYNTIINEQNGSYSFDKSLVLGVGQRISSLVIGVSKKF